MVNNITYKDFRTTYLNLSSFIIEKPISLNTLNNTMYNLNLESLNNEVLDKIEDSNYISEENKTTDCFQKSIEEIINYNTNSYYKDEEPFKLSFAIINKDQKKVFEEIENKLYSIKSSPLEELINSYDELKSIISNNEIKSYDKLNSKQKEYIDLVYLPIANTIFNYKNNIKQYKITQ